jgi:hypothetical protein
MTGRRGFAAALMLASALAGATVGLVGVSFVVRVAAVSLALGACAVGWSVLSGRHPRRFVLLAILAFAVMGFFSWHLVRSASDVPLRSLHVAALLAYGAVLLAAALRTLRVGDEARALLLSFSIAVPLFIADTLVAPPRPREETWWQVQAFEDPHVWVRYQPYSTGRNYYPDNPRGYFSSTDSPRDSWAIEIHEGAEGRLEHSPSEPGLMRVTLREGIETESWRVKLRQAPFEIQRRKRYAVRFRARADAPRRIVCTVEQNHPPWRLLSPYLELEIQSEWRSFECPFVATASESNARLSFGLATSDVPVELKEVVLRDLSTDRDVEPERHFFVSYRFNGLGFRGPDYAIPAPPGTFRILALGDSITQGVGVHEQDTFVAQLESRLNAAAVARGEPIRYEVVNAGVSGYSTQEERASYELFSSPYMPQVVLLTVVLNDDISYAEEAKLGYISTSDELYSLSSLWARLRALRRGERTYAFSSIVRELLRLNESCRQRGARLAVVTFRQANSEPWLELVDLVNEAVQGTDIPVLDLGPTLLRDRSPEELVVHPIDGHPNEIAHRLAAEEMEKFLRAQGLLPP